jgi:hypothetical protein
MSRTPESYLPCPYCGSTDKRHYVGCEVAPLAPDVVRLVILGRAIQMDYWTDNLLEDFEKALEAFASRVPCEDDTMDAADSQITEEQLWREGPDA